MKRIMVVDDSILIRLNLKKIFQNNGYEVVAEAANGEEACEKYEQYKPDLVTMDITMPVMDGIMALKQICTNNSDSKVIMVSALGQEQKVVEALVNGASHFIVKPFAEADILRKVEDVLNS